MNSGEGGFLTTNNPDFAARAIILSGSYMLYGTHGAAPAEEFFQKVRLVTPNCSARMDNLRAAILRPQLVQLEKNVKRWNERYKVLETELNRSPNITLAAHVVYPASRYSYRSPNIPVALRWFAQPPSHEVFL